ncbi:hypothetical protein ACFW2D_00025 [Streptomyces sp. NPDC058914]|uniref:hypothetical protein n=1 Tax=Streptomyces sp. NPDC058914 TaxID=3346671 RepID=UPI0036A4CBAA
MGYELHMTRASHWLDSEERPISLREWIEFAHNSAALREEGHFDMHGVGRQPVFMWGRPDGVVVGFHWYEGRVTLSGAHAPGVDLVGLADLAAELSASLIGDDGEQYPGSVRCGDEEP